jgi:uncharacterized membrane protein
MVKIERALEIWSSNTEAFMLWNLFLAFIPLILSVWLFRLSSRRSLVWYTIAIAFMLFLPNAPYVLTDIIHLITFIRQDHSIWLVTLVLIPQYLIFIFAGFEAYVISLINLGYYCRQLGWGKYILGIELTTHALSAFGVYLGRFQRFNSWDIMTNPDYLADSIFNNLTSRFPIVVTIVTFVVLTILYVPMKEITLGLIERFRYQKSHWN